MNGQEKRITEYQKIMSEAVQQRKKLGKTMQEVADKTGIKQPNIVRLESMTHEVKVGTLLAYLDALDCTLEIVPRKEKKLPNIETLDISDLEDMSAKQFVRIMLYMYKLNCNCNGGLDIISDDEK